MKKIVLSTALFISISLFAGAQTTGDQGSGSSHTSNSGAAHHSNKGKSSKKGKQAAVNQRKTYTPKETGQEATPTGQEATSINGTNANNPKNAAKDSTHF